MNDVAVIQSKHVILIVIAALQWRWRQFHLLIGALTIADYCNDIRDIIIIEYTSDDDM